MYDPYQRIEQLTDVLGILEDSRAGVTAVEIAMSLGFTQKRAERLLNDLRDVFTEIECESRTDGEYFRLTGQNGTGAPHLAPEIVWVRAYTTRRLDGRDLDNPYPR